MNYLVIVIGSIFSGIFYRLGGLGRDFSKGAIFNSKTRDIGCSITYGICTYLLSQMHIEYVYLYGLSTILLFAALTTYHKWIQRLLDKPDNGKIRWYCWAFTGLCYGMATLPLVFAEVSLWGILARTFLLSLGVTLVSVSTKNAWITEPVRGALIILTLPILGV